MDHRRPRDPRRGAITVPIHPSASVEQCRWIFEDYARSFDTLPADSQLSRPTLVLGVPRVFEKLLAGGVALDPSLAHVLRAAGITILEGYGPTETSARVTLNARAANRSGTVGRPLPGIEIHVAPDGEVLVRGAGVFRGYWHDDDATRAAFDADGWLHTGDLGMLDADGRPFVAALVTLDADALARFAAAHGLSGQSAAELTPTLKLERAVIAAYFRSEIDALYDDHRPDLHRVLRHER